jgi:hypothetical protein
LESTKHLKPAPSSFSDDIGYLFPFLLANIRILIGFTVFFPSFSTSHIPEISGYISYILNRLPGLGVAAWLRYVF